MLVDGMNISVNSGDGGGQNYNFRINGVGYQETTVSSGVSADVETGGVQMNYVPKEGGNTFSLYGIAQYTNKHLQSDNLNDTLRARGLMSASTLNYVYDYGIGAGGRLKRDKLWFYTAFGWRDFGNFAPGSFFNKAQGQFIGNPNSGVVAYSPDPANPTLLNNSHQDNGLRLTWQVSSKDKVNFYQNLEWKYNNYQGASAVVAPEAVSLLHYTPLSLTQATWSHPASNRLLFEAGVTQMLNPKDTPAAPGVTPQTIQITDTLTGLRYGSFASLGSTAYSAKGQKGNQRNGRFSMSYVTGSHAFKTGLMFYHGWDIDDRFVNQSLSYTFRGGVPQSLTQWASPIIAENHINNLGWYSQDQWTIRRYTLNLGMRFDYFNGIALAADVPASRFLPLRHFDAVDQVPHWIDLSPRLGIAYDLSGDGRTAIKGSIGRFVQSMGVGVTELVNPQLALTVSSIRTWADANHDFVPNCDLTNPAANGECGALTDKNFGNPITTTQYADSFTKGFGTRPYNWQISTGIQHELLHGVAVSAGYFRTWYGNFSVTDNLAVTSADFTQYCVTSPVDSRLPGGGGQQLCGLYDVVPSKFGQVNNLVGPASAFGTMQNIFNGVDIGLNARFANGTLLTGGVSFGRTVTDNCVTVDAPARPGFCKVLPPWSAGTQYKMSAVYPLPWWNIQVSATYQNIAGPPIVATDTFRNSDVAASLGRNLAAGPNGTVTVDLIPPQSLFEDRISNLDLRFSKAARVNHFKIRGTFDIFNILNGSTVLATTPTYGPNWLLPTDVQGGRLLKFGAVAEF
jgi:hypothetical protein